MKPRGYQQDALDGMRAQRTPSSAWPKGKPRLVVLPTGTGKGPVQIWQAIWACERYPRKPFLSVQPSIPLMLQAGERYERAGFRVMYEQGDRFATRGQLAAAYDIFGDDAKVVVMASSHSLGRPGRLRRFGDGSLFSGGHVEEAHHSTAPMQRRIMRTLCNCEWTGDTATPHRAGMSDLWDLAYNEMTFVRAIELGWLTDTVFREIRVPSWDLSMIKKPRTGDDISGRDLKQMLLGSDPDPDVAREQSYKLIGQIVARLREEVGSRSCMSFWPNVASTEVGGQLLGEYRPTFAMVGIQAQGRSGGDIDAVRKVRAEAIAKARAGEIRDLALCALGTEGLDWPDLDTVAAIRPLVSDILATQIIGRCARPHSSVSGLLSDSMTADERRALIAGSPKPKAEVLMFCGIKAKVELWHPARLLGGKASDDAPPPALTDRGMTLEEMQQERERAERAREAADEAKLKAEQQRQAESNRKPRMDVPPARVLSYTLEEMRQALHDPPVRDADVKRWQGRVTTTKRRPTEEQRRVLARMTDVIIGTRLLTRQQSHGAVNIAQVHDVGQRAGTAILNVSRQWSPRAAYKEYQYLQHIYRKSPALQQHTPPPWPTAKK